MHHIGDVLTIVMKNRWLMRALLLEEPTA